MIEYDRIIYIYTHITRGSCSLYHRCHYMCIYIYISYDYDYVYLMYIYILSMERHFISDYIFYFGRPLKNIPNFYKIRNCFGNPLGLEIPKKNTWWSIDDRDILYWDWNRLVSLCIIYFWQEPRGSLQCICEYCQRFAMDTLIPYQIVCVWFLFFWVPYFKTLSIGYWGMSLMFQEYPVVMFLILNGAGLQTNHPKVRLFCREVIRPRDTETLVSHWLWFLFGPKMGVSENKVIILRNAKFNWEMMMNHQKLRHMESIWNCYFCPGGE